LLDVIVCLTEKSEKKSGKTEDEKASRGAPQTVPQMAWLFLNKRTAGTPARSSFELKLLTIQTGKPTWIA
jgi:hypothetical protein